MNAEALGCLLQQPAQLGQPSGVQLVYFDPLPIFALARRLWELVNMGDLLSVQLSRTSSAGSAQMQSVISNITHPISVSVKIWAYVWGSTTEGAQFPPGEKKFVRKVLHSEVCLMSAAG